MVLSSRSPDELRQFAELVPNSASGLALPRNPEKSFLLRGANRKPGCEPKSANLIRISGASVVLRHGPPLQFLLRKDPRFFRHAED